jgi:hypothetical protein
MLLRELVVFLCSEREWHTCPLLPMFVAKQEFRAMPA